MKKMIPMLFVAALLATACEKTPDTGKLDDDCLVYTNCDEEADFSKFSTFYVPDSVLIIDDSANKPKYLYALRHQTSSSPIMWEAWKRQAMCVPWIRRPQI